MRQRQLLPLGLSALLFASTWTACKKEDTTEDPSVSFDRASLLTDLAVNVIRPAYEGLAESAIALEAAAVQFNAAPDEANVIALRAAWITAVDAWHVCEVFKLGPQYTNALNSQIANWPENQSLIESEITSLGPIDPVYMYGAGSTRKGLSAIEYLIFGDNSDLATVLAALTSGPNAGRRRTYIASCCTDVRVRSQAVYDAWRPGSGNYEAQFIAGTQSDISGSLNVLVNTWIEHIEWVRREKVQVPAGIETGAAADPEKVENRHSARSFANIRRNVMQWQRILNSAGGLGIDDNLDAVGATWQGQNLAQKIRDEQALAIMQCDAFTVPLSEAVLTQPTAVNELYLTLKRLTVLTKVDLASNLGVIITISDNDGD
jgi:uncharacterized protein